MVTLMEMVKERIVETTLPHKDFKNVKTRFLYKYPNSNLPAVTNSEDILENMVLESFDNLF